MKVFDLYELERGARARCTCSMSAAAKLRALKSIWGSASLILASGVASAQGNDPAPAPVAGEPSSPPAAAPAPPVPAPSAPVALPPAAEPPAPAPPAETTTT